MNKEKGFILEEGYVYIIMMAMFFMFMYTTL